LFWDAGRSYLVYSKDEGAEGEQGASPPLYILPFDVGAHAPTGPATLLWAGVHRGARLLRCLGWYYLLVDGTAESDGKMDKGASFAGEHACTRVYRSKTAPHAGGFLDGNFESSPVPVLNNGAHADVRGTSRLNLVRGERGWTAIFHAVRRAPEQSESEAGSSFTPSPFGPETYMANAAWVDAWPVINGGEHVGLTPDAEGMRWLPEVDEFEDEFIGGEWDRGENTRWETELTL
jgi:beta-xylosidase